MPNVKAIVEYDGTGFCGFQRQPTRPTIQGDLEKALGRLLGEWRVPIVGAGRTDAGVHASGQTVNFTLPERFPLDRICEAMNGKLPVGIRLKSAEVASDDFHARYSAVSRTYIYAVLNRDLGSVFLKRYTWHVRKPLDLDAMICAADKFIGTQDFASFGMPDKPGRSTVRQVMEFRMRRRKHIVFVKIRANAFLRGMARAMVGTLVDIGQGKRSPQDLDAILAARDRQAAGTTAPPQGLFLTKVEY